MVGGVVVVGVVVVLVVVAVVVVGWVVAGWLVDVGRSVVAVAVGWVVPVVEGVVDVGSGAVAGAVSSGLGGTGAWSAAVDGAVVTVDEVGSSPRSVSPPPTTKSSAPKATSARMATTCAMINLRRRAA